VRGPSGNGARSGPSHCTGCYTCKNNHRFADWTQVFGDPVMTAALLDRLTHRAHIINGQWESYRLKQSLKGKDQREKKQAGS